MEKYSVYVLPDESGNVIAVNSSMFQPDLTGWVRIDEGTGSKYLHAQGNYFDKPIFTEGGAYRYKLENGIVLERTDAEIAEQEKGCATTAQPTINERLQALESAFSRIKTVIEKLTKETTA